MIVDGPRRPEIPQHLVLAFMAGLSFAAGLSGWCYVEKLLCELQEGRAARRGIMRTLEKLRTAVGRMTDPPWTTNPASDPDGWPAGAIVAATGPGQRAYAEAKRGSFPASDLKGIVALRNAAPALLDLVEAVGRWVDGACSHDGCEAFEGQHGANCPIAVADRDVADAFGRLEALP